jgi:hypothetical protein
LHFYGSGKSQPNDLLHNGISTSEDSNPDETKPVKNPAAVALGRLSGLKAGTPGEKTLTKE